jgi:hypothetical protein
LPPSLARDETKFESLEKPNMGSPLDKSAGEKISEINSGLMVSL